MRKIARIVVHWSASGDISVGRASKQTGVDWWHAIAFPANQDPYTGLFISYHKLIELDGTMQLGRDERSAGWHTEGFNQESLAVVLVGGPGVEGYGSEAQLGPLNMILKDWMMRYNLKPTAIFFHSDLNSTECPGPLDRAAIRIRTIATPKPQEKREVHMQYGRRHHLVASRNDKKLYIYNPHPTKTIFVTRTAHNAHRKAVWEPNEDGIRPKGILDLDTKGEVLSIDLRSGAKFTSRLE